MRARLESWVIPGAAKLKRFLRGYIWFRGRVVRVSCCAAPTFVCLCFVFVGETGGMVVFSCALDRMKYVRNVSDTVVEVVVIAFFQRYEEAALARLLLSVLQRASHLYNSGHPIL